MKKDYHKILLFAFVGILIQGTESTIYSLPDTAEIVQSCPSSKGGWMARSEMKNCSGSTNSNMSYHCLINEWGNASVEVCAVSRVILYGKCAEYNFGAKRIQSSSIQRCSTSKPRCPDAYDSGNAYMYQACYKNIDSHNSQKAFKTVPNPLTSISETEIVVISISLIILAIIVLSTVYLVLKRKLCPTFKRHSDECLTPCMDNNKDLYNNKKLIIASGV